MSLRQTILQQALLKAVHCARFAPSSHNSQPWLVRSQMQSDAELVATIAFDSERMLDSLPWINNEMYLSCGAFTGLLQESLIHQGFAVTLTWCGEAHCLATVTVTDSDNPCVAPELLTWVRKRHTARGPYQPIALTQEQQQQLQASFSDQAVQAVFFDSDVEKAFITDCVRTHAALDFANKTVWAETYRHIQFTKNGKKNDNYRDYGFTLEHLFGKVSPLFAWAFQYCFHPNRHRLYQLLALPKQLAKGLASLVSETPCFFALTVEKETPEAFWRAGMALSSFGIKATAMKLSMHPVSVLLQNNEPRQLLNTLLNQPRSIAFFARIGLAEDQGTASPRRTISSIYKP